MSFSQDDIDSLAVKLSKLTPAEKAGLAAFLADEGDDEVTGFARLDFGPLIRADFMQPQRLMEEEGIYRSARDRPNPLERK